MNNRFFFHYLQRVQKSNWHTVAIFDLLTLTWLFRQQVCTITSVILITDNHGTDCIGLAFHYQSVLTPNNGVSN